jgi:hypothetical protein
MSPSASSRTRRRLMLAVLMLSGCWGTPKVSTWSAPRSLTYEQVFNAAVRAGGDNGFTVVSSDRGAGAISMQREYYGGEHKDEKRRMSVNVRQVGEAVQVSTNVMGTDFGVLEGAMGGTINAGLTKRFYANLFQELQIADPASRTIMMDNGRY